MRRLLTHAATAVLIGVVLSFVAGVSPAAASSTCRCTSVSAVPLPAVTPTGSNDPFGVTDGPGGTWVSDGGLILRFRPDGRQDSFAVPDAATADVGWLTWDGRNRVWFSDRGNNRLGYITGDGRIREWEGHSAGGIVLRDGIVWYTDSEANLIGRFDPRTESFTTYTPPTADSWPLGLTVGPDRALWFIERTAGQLGRMTPDGEFREWKLADGAFPNRIVVGPDRALWFTELNTSMVGRMSLRGPMSSWQPTETPVAGGPVGITVGPDRRVYVALYTTSSVGRLDRDAQLERTWPVTGGSLQVAFSHGYVWTTYPFNGGALNRVDVHCDDNGRTGSDQ